MKLRRLVIFFVVVFISSSTTAAELFIETGRPIRVAAGRTVSLNADHLSVTAPALTQSCKIVVVRGAAFTERGGFTRPQVFSCYFAQNNDRVTYTHSGSPLSTNDSVSLRVFAFGNFSESPLIRDVTLNVEVTTRPSDKLVVFGATKGGLECVLSGLSDDLERLRMAFSYDIADNVTCTLTYNASSGYFPAKGQLVDKIGKPVSYFAIDCWEFAFSGMRYRHLKPFSPALDYIPLTARVEDGAGRLVEQENVFIPVRILGALENYPPQVLASSALKLVLKSPYLTLFTSEVLSFVDWDANDASRLVVNITQQPSTSLGHFVNLLRPTERISSFTVGDVASKLIAFQPAPRAGSELSGSGEARFVAFDDHFTSSEQVTIQISLAYSSSSFPRARVRQALYVLRGSAQPISTREIEFVANAKESHFKKPQIQRIFFEKPKCGKILLRKASSGALKEATSFTLSDLTSGQNVVYLQTILNCSSDFVVVHIQDDFVELRLGLPVYVVPKATEPPILLVAKPFVVRQALQFVLNRQQLLAVPSENSTENRCRRCVTYRVVKPPKFGSLESASNSSQVQEFTQFDVDEGSIRYQHNGANEGRDELVLRLEDDDGNVGNNFDVSIKVKPYSPEKISALLTNSNVATLNESDFLILSEKYLKYKYQAASDREIEYVVVKPPYFLETDASKVLLVQQQQQQQQQPVGDAGKLVIFSSGNVPARRSSEQIVSFTQSDVKDGRVAYFAPNSDIGSRARVAQFVFDVKGPEGVAKAQVFKINILPINNRPPRVHETTLSVKAGEAIGLLPSLQVDDADSPVERLSIAVEQTPRHGDLVVNGTERLSLGDKVTFEQLGQVEYRHHQQSSDRIDTFRLMAFDGQYHSSGTISVSIQQPDILDKIFVSSVDVFENEPVSLTVNRSLELPSNASMKFLVVRSPFHGKLLLNDREVRKFYSRDLVNGRLVFAHPKDVESGFEVFEDSLTILGIATSSDLLLDSHQLLLRTISIKIHPTDNRPPRLEIVGLSQLAEGQATKIDASMIAVDDSDSPLDNLLLEIVSLPKFGQLTLQVSNDSFELAAGMTINVTQFRLGDIALVYNNTKNDGVEENQDAFLIRASDGIHKSQPPQQVSVEILPESDEIPTVELVKPTPVVEEGGEVDLAQLFSVRDLDRPAENLTLIFVKFPKFGSIVLQPDDETIDLDNNKTLNFQLNEKQPIVIYRHDGSENLSDQFDVLVSDGTFNSGPVSVRLEVKPVDDEKPRLVRWSGEIFRLVNSTVTKIKLTSNDVTVEDADTKSSDVIFTLMEKPRQMTLLVDNVMAVSFNQADIDEGRVNLMLPSSDFVAIADRFLLSAVSGEKRFELSNITMLVKLVRENAIDMTVLLGRDNFDKPLELNLTSELDEFDVAFVPVGKSTGQDDCFFFSDSSFTLEDLKNAKIRPIPGPLLACQKMIKMELRHLPSSSVIGRLLVNFTVEEKKPEVTYSVAKRPGVIERLAKRVFGFVLTTDHLHTVSSDSERKLEDAVYEVQRNPSFGILADLSATTSTLDSLRTFTQQQIDSKQIVYVLTKLQFNSDMTSDSFVFDVLDGSTRLRLLVRQQFDAEWSFVEFEQDQIVACERDGVVEVPIRRVGFANSTASVQVRVRQRHKTDAFEEAVTFDSGNSRLLFTLKIEGVEKTIRALLRSPVNTLLGSSRKVSIKVLSSKRPPCNHREMQVEPVESVGSLAESRRIFSLRSKMLDQDDEMVRTPSRKSCQTGWLPLQSLGKNSCYAQLPLATHYWDAHRRCKSLGGHLPSAATMSPALLRELSDLSLKKPIWVDAPNLASSSKKLDRSTERSCAVIRNMAIALRRCSVAKARVVCVTDL